MKQLKEGQIVKVIQDAPYVSMGDDEALDAIAKNEVELLKNLSEVLDEDLTLNELIINVFDKERFH